jgi:homoserine kinase type II
VAVYTDVPAEELDAFLARYEIGKLLSYKGIAEGVQNSNFLLHTDAGFFILTLYERLVEVADIPFFIGLMEHLALRGINCPQPVRMRDGNTLGDLCGRAAAIVTFLDGVWMRRVEPRHCIAVGEALAKLHLAGADFKGHRDNALSATKLRPLFESCADRIDHADLFPDNVFFLGERLSGLIDFYFACNDMFAYDVAICLNAWCFENDHSYNVTKGRALLQAYARVRPLTDDELTAMPLLARGAALRFLATRVVDWLNVPPGALVRPKAPQEYFRKLRFHQHVTSVDDYGIKARELA